MGTTSTTEKERFKSVPEMLTDARFKRNLQGVIRDFNGRIPHDHQIKRHPFQRLDDAGKWNADGLIKVYTEYYIDKSVHHPTAVREFVFAIISRAARMTIIQYNKSPNV